MMASLVVRHREVAFHDTNYIRQAFYYALSMRGWPSPARRWIAISFRASEGANIQCSQELGGSNPPPRAPLDISVSRSCKSRPNGVIGRSLG